MYTEIFPKLHAYLNKKRFESYLKKAKKKGIEQAFLKEWNMQINDLPFEKQTGYESWSSYHIVVKKMK